jgi:hypothetical protein
MTFTDRMGSGAGSWREQPAMSAAASAIAAGKAWERGDMGSFFRY